VEFLGGWGIFLTPLRPLESWGRESTGATGVGYRRGRSRPGYRLQAAPMTTKRLQSLMIVGSQERLEFLG
jgi:hypothetical protein